MKTLMTISVILCFTAFAGKTKSSLFDDPCKATADETWWAVMEHTGSEYMADQAYYIKYNACMNEFKHADDN